MPEIAEALNSLDERRILRARELSEMKRQFTNDKITYKFNIHTKAITVLCYAHWEGFYNECVQQYLKFCRHSRKRVRDLEWTMLIGIVSRDTQKLRDKNHSAAANYELIESLRSRLASDFEEFDSAVIEAKSNLNFERLAHNFKILNFNIERFQKYRLRIDKELVGWRHQVAHGDTPDLSSMIIADHIDFASTLLLELSDSFQEELSRRF